MMLKTTRNSLLSLTVMVILLSAAIATACNGGLRPTLVDDPAPTPQPVLDLNLSPAPPGTAPLPPASPDFALESSVDDALLAWAADRSIPYIDSCALVTPEPGQLCDVATERETVRLLGPSADSIWYVVTVLETDSFDFGTGYRVVQVDIAG